MERFLLIKNLFESTVSSYLTEDSKFNEKIILKKDHSFNVVENIEKIAQSLDASEDELVVSKCIALLHDVGRFEQLKKYDTFSDKKSEDHAALGVKIIDEAEILDCFEEDEREDIRIAISNHNKFTISSFNNERTEMYAKLIRDADKLDIYRLVTEYYSKNNHIKNSTIELELPEKSSISRKVYEAVMKERNANYNDLESLADFKILQMAWVYDINYKRSFKIINEKSYIKNVYDSMSKNDEVIDVYRKVKIYLENNL
jgi:hypothetical protein